MNIETLKQNAEYINSQFPFQNLKYKRERDIVSGMFSKHEVAYIAKTFDCVQAIFYSDGANSYRYYAPKGFVNYIRNDLYFKLDLVLVDKGNKSKKTKI